MSEWKHDPGNSFVIGGQRKRLYGYSILWGLIAFSSGIAITLITLPETFQQVEIPQWKMATWIWLNAHGVGIEGTQVGGIEMAFETVTFIKKNPQLHLLRVIPVLMVTMSGLLVTASMGGATRDRHILENSVIAASGYLLAGLAAIIVSDARPGIGLIVVLIFVLGGALYLGSIIANQLPIPVFAVTTLSGLAGIGLFLFIAAGVVSTVAIPLGKHALGGGIIASVSLWVANNLD